MHSLYNLYFARVRSALFDLFSRNKFMITPVEMMIVNLFWPTNGNVIQDKLLRWSEA